MRRKLCSFICIMCLSACGGGGGAGSGMLIEGTLDEGGGTEHLVLKHAVGQKIEGVEICALGECSTTDGAGQWGFVAPESFAGGVVRFSIDGHGITATSDVTIPPGAHEVFVHFRHVEGGMVETHHVTADGVTYHNGGHAHE